MPPHDDKAKRLTQATELHRRNALDDARKIYEEILSDDPHNADTLHWLGVLSCQQGQGNTGAALIRQAIALHPIEASYHINLGNVLASIGDLNGSQAAYQRAIALNPNSADARCNLGITLTKLGQLNIAEDELRYALALRPAMSSALNQLAQLLYRRDKQQEALQLVRESLAVEPRNPQTHLWYAKICTRLGDVESALRAYEYAVKLHPDYAEAYLGAAQLLHDQGQFNFSLQAVGHALTLNPQLATAHKLLARLLCQLAPNNHQAKLERDLIACYQATDVDHQALARVTANQLLHKYHLHHGRIPTDTKLHKLISLMATDELWLGLLSSSINTDPQLERLLTATRRSLLLDGEKLPEGKQYYTELTAALALQTFANEYLLAVTDEELLFSRELLNNIQQNHEINIIDKMPAILACAMYHPLWKLLDKTSFIVDTLANQKTLVQKLFQHTLIDIREEHKIRSTIQHVAPERDAISKEVRAHYEENPYPRWQTSPTPNHASILNILHNLPGFKAQGFPTDNLELLIAGCGTGYEPIDIGMMDTSLKITAVDLSASSLAYAARMAKKIGVENVEFLQGDILELNKLNKEFNIVVSTGVLHHMAKPEQGWQSLCQLTKPGGVQRISLYSERARRRIVAARVHIKDLCLTSSPADIRTFREHILHADADSALAELRDSDDLYSMSGCRDLLFHSQEHHFNLRQIAQLLERLGLHFIAMDLPDVATHERFQHMFPEEGAQLDLQRWDIFEASFPDTFAGMYQFWCQKPG